MTISMDVMNALEIACILVAAIWGISKIRSTTEGLAISINHLTSAIDKLDSKLGSLDGEVREVGTRITKVEGVLETLKTQ